jgi:hypothetical protein
MSTLSSPEPRAPTRDLAVLALVAAATLLWEVLVTRLCALRLAFHYGFLIVSGGLLGMGAAGSLLFVWRERILAAPQRWLERFALAALISLPTAYLWMVRFPIDPDVRVDRWETLLPFLAYNLGAVLPFLAGGLVIGQLLMVHAARIHRAYAADLGGAAVGAMLCPLLLWAAGAAGAAAAAAVLLAAAGTLVMPPGPRRRGLGLVTLLVLAAVPFAESWLPVPSSNEIRYERGQSVRLGEERVYSRWSALSRVDVYRVAEDERGMFMEGEAVTAFPEEQLFITQDSSAGTFLHDFTGTPEGRANLARSLYGLGTEVLGAKSVFIVGAGGGADLWGALGGGAERIKAVELNRQIVELHTEVFRERSSALLERPGVEIVHAEGRAALLAEQERFDLLQMSGIDTWTALASGAYMLAENFLYTVEALEDMFAVTGPEGAVQVTRLSGEVEVLRLLGIVHEAWQGTSEARFEDCVAVIHAGDFASILCRKVPFTGEQRARLMAFVERAGMGADVLPGRTLGGVVEAFVRAPDKAAFQAAAASRIDPVHDDRPYFFHFTRFRDWAAAKALLHAPASQVQGNPLFVLVQLGVAVLLSALLLLLPRRRRAVVEPDAPRVATLGYFLAVGVGFVALEVTLMQQLTLLVGHPVYSITVTLASILLATGLGAWGTQRWFRDASAPFLLVPATLAVLVLAWNAQGAELVRWAASQSQAVRLALGALVVAPFGLVLGVPFAHGIALLERRAPSLVPWAWAINAAGTVVGSIATAIASMELGFPLVLLAGVACYVLAWWSRSGLCGPATPLDSPRATGPRG